MRNKPPRADDGENDLTPELQSALDAWEVGQGDTPDPVPHPALAGLRDAFDALPDVRRLHELVDAAMNDTAEPVPVTIPVQPGLLRLLAHVAELDAAAAGRAPAPVSAALAQRVHNDLHMLLHQLATDPTRHPHYAKAWNALCAAEGAPELAVPADPPQSGPQAAERGPF
ncbi:hypothetical protein [Halodurantibacterium flavum]|uniref:DUF2894 domain-containing protein n=1 Tax=Halodurantibacterium flavum TaxID=1382802 RepID=A0ABW4S8Y0_9RHOB